jgi:hypothetical protein
MTTKIAQLNILVSDGNHEGPSPSHLARIGPREFNIVLNPIGDKYTLATFSQPTTLNALQSILAHEMGHFVATITGDPTHQGKHALPAEIKAWTVADAIAKSAGTTIDPSVRNFALNGYEAKDFQERKELKA